MARQTTTPRPRFGWHKAIAALLLIALSACAADPQPQPSALQTITISLNLDQETPTPQGIPAGSGELQIAIRIYRSDVLEHHLISLTDTPNLPEPMYTSDEPHPVFGADIPKRIRFTAQGIESELGGTTLFLLQPTDTLQLSFQTDLAVDLTLVATVFEANAELPGSGGYPTGVPLAYGTQHLPLGTDPDGVATSARIGLQSFASSATLTPRNPIDTVFAGREYDFALTVNLDVNGTPRTVPGSDYSTTYTLTNATLAPSYTDTPAARARGTRVLTGAVAPASELVVAYEVVGIQAAGDPAVFARTATYGKALSIPFGDNGITFDIRPPALNIAGIDSNELFGSASDEQGGSGLATLRIFDGPQLIASSVADEVEGATITFVQHAWYAPLAQLNATSGDTYHITAVATDVAGNETQRSGILNLATATFTPSEPATIAAVAVGSNHTMILKTDGTLWATGANGSGQLGDGTQIDRSTPVQVTTMTNVAAVAAGGSHTMIVKADGTLWATGRNEKGQLGDGTTEDKSTPVQVTTMANVAAVAAGGAHTMIVKTDGTLWATGWNSQGQLGVGTLTDHLTPIQVTAMTNVAATSASTLHTMIVKTDGTLWATGFNATGELGDGTPANKSTPVQVTTMANVAAVSAGFSHTMIVKTDGTLWATGWNSQGQHGDGTTEQKFTPVQVMTITNVAAVAAATNSTMIVKTDGTLWATGGNSAGQHGDGTTAEKLTLAQVTTITNVAAVATGSSHTMILRTDGTLFGTGNNTSGQLGNGTTANTSTPVQVISGP